MRDPDAGDVARSARVEKAVTMCLAETMLFEIFVSFVIFVPAAVARRGVISASG